MVSERCAELRDPGYVQVTISMIIVIGLLISYLPQHFRIISRRTSEGISPWFVLLGTTSATAGLANILTVPPSRADIACCREVETFACAAGLFGIVQLGLQWICWALILVLFLVFFRYDQVTVSAMELGKKQPKWQTAVLVASLCFLHGLVVVSVTGVLAIARPGYLTAWANVMGVSAAASAVVQYLPQIYTTYQLKHIGSLSITTMCIQTPGGLLFAASLFARLGWSGWSSWGIFVLTAGMQAILLSLAIYYEIEAKRASSHGPSCRPEDHSLPDSDSDEQHHRHDHRPAGQSLRRPAKLSRQYSDEFDDDLPGPYTSRPDLYADTQEELDHLLQREERQVDIDSAPLLRPGGIGHPFKDYQSI